MAVQPPCTADGRSRKLRSIEWRRLLRRLGSGFEPRLALPRFALSRLALSRMVLPRLVLHNIGARVTRLGLQSHRQSMRRVAGPHLLLRRSADQSSSSSIVLTRSRNCPRRKPPFLAVKRPARPYKSPIQNRFS